MNQGPIRVLIIDDSPIMRHLLTEAIGNSHGFEVVGAAHNAADAWTKIQTEGPDVITLDVEMPGMDGVTFLEYLMRMRPLPVVMVSGLTQSGSVTTIRALQLGALDFIGKPTGGAGGVGNAWIAELIAKLRRAVQLKPLEVSRPWILADAESEIFRDGSVKNVRKCNAELIAIGSGTGGVESLRKLLSLLPKACPPVIVVHDFPDIMGRSFMEYAQSDCAVRLKMAEDGDLLVRGQGLLCSERAMSFVDRRGRELRLRTVPVADAKQGSSRIDRLFESAAQCAGHRATAILLDAASQDGTQGLRQVRMRGGQAILQRRERLDDPSARFAGAVTSQTEAALEPAGECLFVEQMVPTLFGGASNAVTPSP